MSALAVPLEARNASIEELFGLLERQHDVKYDVVVPSTHLRYSRGDVVVAEGATSIDMDGVSNVDARLRPTAQFEDGIAARLDIPRGYLRKMREQEEGAGVRLLDENVNHWLHAVERNWLLRGFRVDDPAEVGIARAFLSDRYRIVDHIDTLLAVLDGIRKGGIEGRVTPKGADLSERRMRVVIEAPEVRARADKFLENYRSPFNGRSGTDLPFISAGIAISNSETGGGAFQIAPYITVEVCTNGMTANVDAMRKVHIGGQLEEGQVEWSEDTKRKGLELIQAQAQDAVRTFLSQDYINRKADELNGAGEKVLERPVEAVEQICKGLRYTDAEKEAVLDFFVRGGDTRPTGVMQAVTAYAQTVTDPERAMELEDQAFDVLDRALVLAR